MTTLTKPLFILLFEITFISIIAQPLHLNFNHLTPNQDLSQATNPFIYHDTQGWVWISSTDGLNRFDGINIKTYRPISGDTTSMDGKNIQSHFFESQEGDIWFCTTKAINCYRRRTDRFDRYYIPSVASSNEPAEYYIFHFDETGNLWVKLKDQLYTFNIYSEEYDSIGELQGIRCKLIEREGGPTKIYSYHKNTKAGLQIRTRFSPKGLTAPITYFTGQNKLPELKIHDILFEDNDQLWIAAEEGLYSFSLTTLEYQPIDYYKGQAIRNVRSIVDLDDNQLMVSSSSGLLLFDKCNKQFIQQINHDYNDPTSLASNNVFNLYLDRVQNLWVSLWTVGVDYAHLKKTKFQKFKLYLPEGDQLFDTGSLLEDLKGQIWCGSNLHGLMVLNSNREVIPELRFRKPGIRQIFEDKNGRIWLVPWANYLIYRDSAAGSTFKELPLPGVTTSNLGNLFQLPDGRLFLTKNAEAGVLEIITAPISKPKIEVLQDTFFTRHHYKDAFITTEGTLLLANKTNALSIFNYTDQEFSHSKTIAVEGYIRSFYQDSIGQVWIGGDYGLLKLPLDRLIPRYYGQSEGFLNPYVYGILPGRASEIWLSTNRGLVRFDTNKEAFQTFTMADGLQENEYNTMSILQQKDGLLWFGGIKGFNIFNPKSVVPIVDPPQINWIDIQLKDSILTPAQKLDSLTLLKVPYPQRDLSFNFVAHEYSDPKRNKLKYRLELADGTPYQKDWIEVKNELGFANYTKLKPQKYKFKVSAINSDGLSNKYLKVFNFVILPPFWQTWWFYFLLILLSLSLIYAAVKIYINSRLKKQRMAFEQQQALQQERNRIASELHDDLGAGLSLIHFLSDVEAEREKPNVIQKNITKISTTAVELLERMGDIIWAMNTDNDSLDNLIGYLRRYTFEYIDANGLECQFEIPETIPNIDLRGKARRNILLSVKEGLHNIVKHAEAQSVILKIALQENILQISIKDDGKGLKNDVSKKYNGGNGLRNIRKRITELHGSVEFIVNQGTTISMRVPLAD